MGRTMLHITCQGAAADPALKKCDVSGTTGADKDGDNFNVFSQFARYFTIENSIKGMKVLLRILFSIVIGEVNILKGQWDVDNVASDATSLL